MRKTLKLPFGLGLAVLVVAAAMVIPTMASAGDPAAAPDAAAHDTPTSDSSLVCFETRS